MTGEVPLNLIPDEFKRPQGAEVPFDMLPDEIKAPKISTEIPVTIPTLPYTIDTSQHPITRQGEAIREKMQVPAEKVVGKKPVFPFPTLTMGEETAQFSPEYIAGEGGAVEWPAELRAIPPTLKELATTVIPGVKYLTEEGGKELKGDFFPRTTTTDPAELSKIGKELRGEIPERVSPYESLAKETKSALEFAAFPTALRTTGAIAETVLPKVVIEFFTKPISKLITDSVWYRKMTIPERNLVVQSISDMKKAGLSDADIARKVPSYWQKLAEERMQYEGYREPPVTPMGEPPRPPIPPTPPPVTTVEGIRPFVSPIPKPPKPIEGIPPSPLPEGIRPSPIVKGQEVPAEMIPSETKVEELKPPKVKGVTFRGVQKIPGEPDQYVFNEESSKSTFYTKSLSKDDIISNRDRIKAKFAEEAPLVSEEGVEKGKEPWEMTREEITQKHNYIKSDIENILETDPGHEYALRALPSGDLPKLGQKIKISHVWIDGRETTKSLGGTSAISVEPGGIEWTFNKLHNPPEHAYGGDKMALITGDRVSEGTDPGEVILKNARVIAIYDKKDLLQDHQWSIYKALKEGKPVPSEVLKDYPDLAKEAKVEVLKSTKPFGKPSPKTVDVYGEIKTQIDELEKMVPPEKLKILWEQAREESGRLTKEKFGVADFTSLQLPLYRNALSRTIAEAKPEAKFERESVYKGIRDNEGMEAEILARGLNKNGVITIDTHIEKDNIIMQISAEQDILDKLSDTGISVERRPSRPGIDESYRIRVPIDQVERVLEEIKPEAKVEVPTEITVGLDKPRKPEKFSDITRWVIKQGGVKKDDPNIDPIGWSRKQGGPIGLISKNARYGLDELATMVEEAGFPPMTTNELSEAISNRVRGGKAPRGYTEGEIAKLEDEWNEEHKDIIESRFDPQILKPDTRNALTQSLDDEIIGMKEEWREQGYTDKEIKAFVDEAYETAKTQGIIEEPEQIRTIFTEPTEELIPPKGVNPDTPQGTRVRTPDGREGILNQSPARVEAWVKLPAEKAGTKSLLKSYKNIDLEIITEELVPSPKIQQIQKDLGITESKLPLEERVGLLERAGYPEEAKKLRGERTGAGEIRPEVVDRLVKEVKANKEPAGRIRLTEEISSAEQQELIKRGVTFDVDRMGKPIIGYSQEARTRDLREKVAPSPTRKGETLLPGMKVGLEQPKAEGVTPTLEGTPLGEAARKAEVEKVQPGLFGKPEMASVGEYDIGGGGAGGAAERPKEPPGPMVNIVEMPEMVELFNKLSGGEYPTIKEKLRAFHGLASGIYRPGEGKIDLRADIFADPAQAKATLAHEIFHFVDDLPEYILKQRGNIFGRIASLKKYMKKYLEAYEGAPGPLTNADRSRFMKEAREALKLEKASAEEQAASFKDIKLLPEDVKAIWNDVEARTNKKPIYDFIVSLSEVEKNQIVREAMRGIVSEVNQRRFRISQPLGGRPFKDWDQRLRDIFNNLVREEIEKRQLFTYDTMMSELKNLSTTWKPFTPIPGDKFTKYRFSPAELYADAGSVLLNNPALLADKAPSFYKAFFNYIHRKPEVKQVYDDIQARIGMGEEAVLGHRREEVKAMFGRGEEALVELRKPHPYNILENLRTAFVSRREGLLKLKREAEKRGGKLDPEKNPDYWTEELPYISSPIFDTIRDINNIVLKPAQTKGITQSDIGEYLLYRREATERAKLANPKGYTEADALKQMDFLKKELGDDRFNTLTDLVKKNWEIRQKDIFPILEKSRAFSPDTMTHIKDNENYATWLVREHLEEKYGSGVTAKIYRQIGTLKEVINPLTATVMKDMSLIRMAERKMIAEGTVNFLRENFPKEITPAETRWTGNYNEIKEPSDPKLGLIAYTQDGKVIGYYVPKSIANIFDRDPYDFQPILRLLSVIQQPLKAILVSHNPGWWVWNIQRDLKASAKQVPGMNIPKTIQYAIKAMPDAYKDVFKDVSTEDVKAMYQIKALGVGRYWASSELGPESHLDKIVQSFGETPVKYDSEVLEPFRLMWNYLKAGAMLLDKFGAIGERLPKIAAYKFLKENTSLPDKEIAHLVRKRAGSPDFWERGGLDFLYNNVFWFSNAGKEGIRAALEAAKENPSAYAWKTVKYDVLPKLLMLAGGAGLLGVNIKKLMDNIPERDKGNYLTIPIGETTEGKTVYFVMPHDFQGQVIGGLIWKAMRTGKAGNIGDIVDYMAGGLPYTGLNPILGLASDWKQYLTGKNPYDPFRGKYVLPEKVFEAGGKEAIKGMAKYSSNQLGGGIIYRFKGKNEEEIKNELEKILGLPIAGNFLNRFLRVSDAGRADELRYVSEEVRTERAKELIKMDNAIKESFMEPSKITMHPKQVYDKLVKDKSIQRHTYNDFLDRLTNSYAYKIGTPESDAILGAKSAEEKAKIILKIIEKQKGQKKITTLPPGMIK